MLFMHSKISVPKQVWKCKQIDIFYLKNKRGQTEFTHKHSFGAEVPNYC